MQLELAIDAPAPAHPLEKPLGDFQTAVAPFLVFNPHATLSEYQGQWYGMMEVCEAHAAPLLARAKELIDQAKTAGRMDKRRLLAEARDLEAVAGNFRGLAESAWIDDLHPKVEALLDQLRPDDDAREHFHDLLSNDRACEVWGDSTLRQLMLYCTYTYS